jgi:hypothetical protein
VGYLEEKFSSKVGPGGYPPAGWNQPLLWNTPSLVPPSVHPWACEEWNALGSALGDEFKRVRRQDTFRRCLYAAGRVALGTDEEGKLVRSFKRVAHHNRRADCCSMSKR